MKYVDLNKKPVSLEEINEWLNDQITDIDSYDPTFEMEDGEHITGAILRRQKKIRQNKMVDVIKNYLKDAIFEKEVLDDNS